MIAPTRTMSFIAALCAAAAWLASVPAVRADATALTSLPRVFADDFESKGLDRWEPASPEAWRIEQRDGGHVASQFQHRKVDTPVRSPFNRNLVRDLDVASFVLDAKVQSTSRDYGHRDVCLFFGYQDPAHMYYVHLGKKADDHANQIFVVDGKPRAKISTKSTEGTNWDDEWHHVRVARDVRTGQIDIYFDDMKTPVMQAVDKRFRHGRIGIGTFDDTARFDDVVVLTELAEKPAAAAKIPEGFTPLFNGKDLAGWKGLVGDPKSRAAMPKEALATLQKAADEKMRAHWKVVDGVLEFDGKGDSLCTAKDYGDFDMYMDWKIKPKGDSGVYLRGTPQVQIWDTTNKEQFNLGCDKGSGALWNNAKNEKFPLVLADNPVGEWNTFRIKMIGDKVSVWLNGKLVTDNVVLENYWEKGKPVYPTGQIELQNHGNTLYFRNLSIKEL